MLETQQMLPCATLLAVLLAQPAASPAMLSGAPAAANNPSRTIVGEILSIDLTRGLVVVGRAIKAAREPATPRSVESVAVSVDASTKIVRGQRPATITELRMKDQAVVRYQPTPQGAKALSFRVADLVVRTPRPTPSSSARGGGGQ